MMDYDVQALRRDVDNMIDKIYPVGSIYLGVNSINPTELFGGEWEQIEDKFLLAAGTNHASGETGGEETHTLSESEMPSHKHDVAVPNSGSCETDTDTHNHYFGRSLSAASGSARHYPDGSANNTVNTNSDTHSHTVPDHSHSVSESDKGSSQAHNNMPPYLSVFMWKRTA
jgi:hypothetical protein